MGDDVHGLQIQLSAALKERDDAEAALRISNTLNGHRSQRIEDLEAERDRLETAARAYIEGHELALTRAEAAESERDALRAALSNLVKRLDFVHADASYQAVWTLHQIHMGPYRGPTYAEALNQARAALASGGDRE